ncbi:MAG: ABC transporter permease [Marivivens sp.]|jgi:ribose/xylose/arabinose/galactoside ABC-type transport system permease subunit|nr:ABC transporter permease [Marivivens sp.]
MTDIATPKAEPIDTRREASSLRRFYYTNGRAINSALAFVCVWLFFASQNWALFMHPGFYGSYLFSVPPSIILATALVFVITSGEIDLSFPAVIGAGGGTFMTLLIWGVPVIPAAIITLFLGALLGGAVGAIIVYGRISSLVATLGLSFFIVGIVNFLAQGKNLEFREAVGTWGNTFFVGKWNILGLQVPNHFFLSMIWVALMYVLFRYHRFGVRVQMVGDNPDSARQMGINVERIRVGVFVLTGVAGALSGLILVQTANMVWFPLSGKAYLLPVLAAIFVGGTPVWGGVGTIIGAMFGALTIGLIPSGAVGAGFAGFWTEFIFGIVIIATMIVHRFSGRRVS